MIRVSGDASVAGQIRQTEDGRLECHFPDRMVLIANHQVSYITLDLLLGLTLSSYIQTGSTYGGLHTPTSHTCMVTSTLLPKSLSNGCLSLGGACSSMALYSCHASSQKINREWHIVCDS